MLAHRAQGITGPGKFQEQPTPRSGQEKLLAGFGPTWLKAARSSQEAPGATQEHPGVARKSSWLTLGILANMAKGSQEHARKLQEQPKSTQEWPGGAPGWIWAPLANMANKGPRMTKGFREEGSPINTLTCVGDKGDALYYVVWAVGLNPSLTLS